MTWSSWNPLKPFGREKTEVLQFLEDAVEGRLDCRAWDSFIRIPMKGTPQLEDVRVACESLVPEEKIAESGMISHTAEAREKIRELIRRLKEDSNQQPEPMRAKGPHGSP